MRPFEVVGDWSDVDGSVMGSVMGGHYGHYAGADPAPPAAPLAHPNAPPPGHWRWGHQGGAPRQRAGAHMQVHRPDWREGELAPGVMKPDEGMVPLGMTPSAGNGSFSATVTNITWTGQLQKPYRAERLLVSTVRTGTTATGRLLGQFFVGVDLNMGTIQGVDIEVLGATGGFGVRMTLLQAPPGVIISIPVVLSNGLTSPDTIFASVQWLGRIVH